MVALEDDDKPWTFVVWTGLWTLNLVLSNKGPIWQATKIPAQAHLALRGVVTL
jgi:hypothetical protein